MAKYSSVQMRVHPEFLRYLRDLQKEMNIESDSIASRLILDDLQRSREEKNRNRRAKI